MVVVAAFQFIEKLLFCYVNGYVRIQKHKNAFLNLFLFKKFLQIPNMTLSCVLPLPDNRTVLLGSRGNNSVATHSIEYGRTSDYLAVHR